MYCLLLLPLPFLLSIPSFFFPSNSRDTSSTSKLSQPLDFLDNTMDARQTLAVLRFTSFPRGLILLLVCIYEIGSFEGIPARMVRTRNI